MSKSTYQHLVDNPPAPHPKAYQFQDITGQRFGRLVVLCYVGRASDRKALWVCRCDCGERRVATLDHLKDGHISSCGCLRKELNARKMWRHGDGLTRGGKKTSPEYRAWMAMKWRCHPRSRRAFPNHGGRGIQVCRRWAESFPNFLVDMGRKPSPQHSLDRINNDGNYEPGNCRWATSKQQSRNTRRNRHLTFDGKTMTIPEWSEHTGLSADVIKARVYRGWPVEQTLTLPSSGSNSVLRKAHHWSRSSATGVAQRDSD